MDSHCKTEAEEALTRNVSSVSTRALSEFCACARVILNKKRANTHSIFLMFIYIAYNVYLQ